MHYFSDLFGKEFFIK